MTGEGPTAASGVDPIEPRPTLPPGPSERLDRLHGCLGPGGPGLVEGLSLALGAILGGPVAADRFSLQDRAAALGRPMVVAHLDWPRLRARLALGVDPPLAHALADRLLGFERDLAELHLQVTPVEWGLLGFLVAQGLAWLETQAGPLGPWDLVIDRVGPGPFDAAGLGPIVTLRWRVRVGNTAGSARLWLPWALLAPWMATAIVDPAPPAPCDSHRSPRAPVPISCSTEASPALGRFDDFAIDGRIVAGTATLPGRPDSLALRVGKLLLIDGAPLSGDPASPTGPVTLLAGMVEGPDCPAWRADLGLAADGRSLRLTIRDDAGRGEPLSSERPADGVALAIEIGSIRLRLGQLGDLRPGDVLDLGPDAPGLCWVRLGERRVAVGELVRVDTEVGVRIVAVQPERAGGDSPAPDRTSTRSTIATD